MPLVSVPAIYDGKQVKLLEKAPVEKPHRVVVTFIEPAREQGQSTRDLTDSGHPLAHGVTIDRWKKH